MADNTSNTTDAVAAQNAEAANANVGESAPSASATSATAPSTSNNAAAEEANDSFLNNPASQQPSTAGTSGNAPGTASNGMAADNTPTKVSPLAATQAGNNLGVDAPANVNVMTPASAPHPIVHTVQSKVSELRTIISKLEQTPWIIRAGKDLQAFDEWVVQHFEEMKRKL